MALRYQRPPGLEETQYPDVGGALDKLYNAYLQNRQYQDSRTAQGLGLAEKGIDPTSIGMQSNPAFGPLLERWNQAQAQSRLASKSALDFQASQTRENQAQAAKLERENSTPVAPGAVTDPYKRSQIEGQIMDDFMKSQSVKDFDQVKNAVRNISALSSKKGGISDVGQLYSFVKILDPNSVVREGEIALSQNAVPGLDKVALAWNNFRAGRINTEDMNKQIKLAAKDIYGQRLLGLREVQGAYATRAKQYGLNESVVTPDLSIPQVEMEQMFGGEVVTRTLKDGSQVKVMRQGNQWVEVP